MPRKARNKSETNFYHIMVQGMNREFIFKDNYHIKFYKNIISKNLKNSNITILAYCIMNNHAHFLIYCQNIHYLSKFMQKVNLSYSHFYNKKNNRVGFVFRDRYRSQDILNKKQLYTCLHYIHNNPVKAKIVEKMSDYKYSSYSEFFGKKELITPESIKLLFNDSDNYISDFNSIHNTPNSEKFIDIKETDFNKFIAEFESVNNEKIPNIKYNLRLRKKFIVQAHEETNIKLSRLAELLDMPTSTVRYILKKHNKIS